MMPSGHKAFLVSNVKDVELLLMHNKTYAAEYVTSFYRAWTETAPTILWEGQFGQWKTDSVSPGSPTTCPRGSGSTSSRGRSN
jgi:hypothetical protein